MTSLAEQLEQIDRHLADALAACGDGRGPDDAALIETLLSLGRLRRRVDGAVVAATDRIAERDQGERAERLSTRIGCRDVTELLRRALRVDGIAARRYATAARAVHREVEMTSGQLLPGAFPALTAALADGELSLDGFLACTVPLQKAARIGIADRLAADALLARFARGLDLADEDDTADAGEADHSDTRAPAPTTDELAGLTAHIIARLDPDGAEPQDRAAKRRRYFTIGKLRNGTVPVRGEILPEVAAQLQKLMDSLLNPKVDGDAKAGGPVRFRPSDATGDGDGRSDEQVPGSGGSAPERADGIPAHRAEAPAAESADLRNHAQKRHDAFATILMVAAASGGMPLLGGAAPTLVVSVRAEDYVNRTGRAKVEGAGYDVSLGAADHAACAGGVQRVLFDQTGTIVGISTSARLFTTRQRRAIVLRDRKCLIPGCDIPAEWCEIHHVQEYAEGGQTHTGNGVPLCWHHHRTLEEEHWQIRMRNGLPEIRGPNWWDAFGLWRAPYLDYEAVDETLGAMTGFTCRPRAARSR